MQKPRYKSGPSGLPYRKTVAPRVREQHSRRCALSTGAARRCSCRPAFVAQIKRAGKTIERSFPTLTEAVSWAEAAHDAVRRGQHPLAVVPIEAPSLHDLAVSFLHRARSGEALNRSRQPYSTHTISSYEVALRLRVLPHIEQRHRAPMGELPITAIDARAMQGLVDSVATREGQARARQAAAVLSAVLRDGYLRGLAEQLPPRVLLPPPPAARTRALTVEEAERLLKAAGADDYKHRRSLLAPLTSLLLGSGCRISEALGLVWGPDGLDLNAEPPAMHIQRHSTKSAAGVRTIPLAPDIARDLRRHRLASGRPDDGAHVFADPKGQPLARTGRVRFGLRRIGAAAGLASVSPHLLRHTHATWLAVAGVPPTVAAARLGHADGGALFMRVYAHPGAADANLALAALDSYRGKSARAQP
jgi:integrase